MNKEMEEAGKKLMELSADDEAWEIAEARARLVFANELENNAREQKGRTEGLVQGRTEKGIEIAKKMIFDDVKLELISKFTGLSISDLEQIKDSYRN